MRGEHRKLCRIIMRAVVIVLTVAGTMAANQAVAAVRHVGTHRFDLKHSQQIDTSVVKPGTRDFLEPNRPNPLGSERGTTFWFSIAEAGPVRLRIYDFFYNPVMTLIDQEMTTGRWNYSFNPPASMPSGMYFYELKTDRYYEIRRMMYIK